MTTENGAKTQRCRRVRVLSIDGGGVRGIIPAIILAEIERRTSRSISGLFDLIAGTSTGGVLALLLTVPTSAGEPAYTAEDIVQLYENWGPYIFRSPLRDQMLGLWGLVKEKYPARRMEEVLATYFGATQLQDALTEVLIPSFDLDRGIPVYFRRRSAKERPWEHDFPMTVVARATSSAPTYFSPISMRTPSGDLTLIDGGLFANNPALCAFSEARQMALREPSRFAQELLVVSLGTGERAARASVVRSWGLAGWATRLLPVVFDSVSAGIHGQMVELLPRVRRNDSWGPEKQYFRFQVKLDEAARRLDNATQTNMAGLKVVARRFLADTTGEVDEVCEALLDQDTSGSRVGAY